MDTDFLFRPKSCCFCLKLRTGCYIIAAWNLLIGSLVFLDEIFSSIHRFRRSQSADKLAVLFAYDLLPSVTLVFTLLFIYGLLKEKKYFIYLGVTLSVLILAINTFTLVVNFVKYLFGPWYWGFRMIVPELLISSTIQISYIIIIRSYYKQVEASSRPEGILKVTSGSTNEIENPNF